MPPQPPGGAPPQPPGPWQQPPPPPAGAWQQPQGPWQHRYVPTTHSAPKAGFWARFAAAIIDAVVLLLVWTPAWLVLAAGPKKEEACRVDSSGDVVVGGPNNAVCEVPTSTAWALMILLGVAAFVATMAYYAILEGKKGQTLGKQALGIRTVDQYTGQPIGAGRAIGRYFAKILSSVPCYLGYLWMLWDDQRQTWHDKIVSCVVVRS